MSICYVSTTAREKSIRGLKICKALNGELIDCSSKFQRYTIYPLIVLLKLLFRNYRLVIVNNIPAHITLPCLLASRIKGFILMIDFVNLWSSALKSKYPVLSRISFLFEAALYRNIKNGISINKPLSEVVSSLGIKNVIEVYDAAEIDTFTPGYSDKPVFFTAANFRRDEGIDVLLGSLKRLKDKGLRFSCLIAGDGEEKTRLIHLQKELKLQDNVKFLGWAPYKEIPRLMRDASIGVAPIRDVSPYALPIKIFEMLSSGLAVVATDTLTIKSVIEHGKNGLLFKSGDHKGLANRLERLLKDKILLRRLQHNARGSADLQFSWDKQASKLRRYIKSTLEKTYGK